METLSQYVRRVMAEKKLSAVEVECRSGSEISRTYVWSIAHGRHKNISVEKLRALARGLGVSQEELFRVACGTLPARPEPGTLSAKEVESVFNVAKELLLNPELASIVRRITELPPGAWPALLKYVEDLCGQTRQEEGEREDFFLIGGY
jgi:transcriptional regulator with XRE-family HTH domain